MTLGRSDLGRGVRELFELSGIATTDASETNILTGGMASSSGYIDLVTLAGTTIRIEIAETGGLGGCTFKYYGAFDVSGTYPYSMATDTVASASTTYTVVVTNAPRYIKLTMTRSGANNTTAKFKITGAKPGGNI